MAAVPFQKEDDGDASNDDVTAAGDDHGGRQLRGANEAMLIAQPATSLEIAAATGALESMTGKTTMAGQDGGRQPTGTTPRVVPDAFRLAINYKAAISLPQPPRSESQTFRIQNFYHLQSP